MKKIGNNLETSTLGLTLKVQPYLLIKEMMSENSQNILDGIIEHKFRKILKDFNDWQNEITLSLGEDENFDKADREFLKYKNYVHIQLIQDIADFTRNLISLHSDWECVATEDDVAIMETAYEYYKYNEFYGYISLK